MMMKGGGDGNAWGLTNVWEGENSFEMVKKNVLHVLETENVQHFTFESDICECLQGYMEWYIFVITMLVSNGYISLADDALFHVHYTIVRHKQSKKKSKKNSQKNNRPQKRVGKDIHRFSIMQRGMDVNIGLYSEENELRMLKTKPIKCIWKVMEYDSRFFHETVGHDGPNEYQKYMLMKPTDFCSILAQEYIKRVQAVQMAMHPRLGKKSRLFRLDPAVLNMIIWESLSVVMREAIGAGVVKL